MHTTRQKSYRKAQFFLFYGVQVQRTPKDSCGGENTIARRQKAKLISIDFEVLNSFPKFSVIRKKLQKLLSLLI